jgi:hypothetical protein
MHTTVDIAGKPVSVLLSPAAETALARRDTVLHAEMELYFSCMIRKKLRFYDTPVIAGVPVTDQLVLSFRPIMTARCGNDYAGAEPPTTDFPITRTTPFVPRWVRIDFREGSWQGEFGD